MYGVVNEALNGVFLAGRFESRPLYLVLDRRGREELADALGSTLNCDVDDVEATCCQVVGQTLSRTGDPYKDLEVELFKWICRGRKGPPPFTALLFSLSHAAELMVSDGQFSSNNYYRRLADLLVFDWQKLSLHGKTTENFWRSLNKWLADTDFQYGRPTARASNTWKYVGLAMSQAIVREEDRQRFHDLFSRYGFTATDVVTEEAISQYITNWICTGKPTQQLKSAWSKAELRPRICEAAIAELQEWGQEEQVKTGSATRGGGKLSLATSFRHDLLGRSVSLWFGREADMADVSFPPTTDSSLTLVLGNSTFAGFATVEPRSSLDLVKSLSTGLELNDESGRGFAWSPRAVVPLSRSEKGSYWTEVNRVTIGVEHLVLARDDKRVRESVEAGLEQVAQPGYTVTVADRLKGLPAGWVLYEGVRVLRQLENVEGFQSPLSPVGATSGLQVLGGLKIGQGIWHRERPPSINLDAREGESSLVAWDGTSPDDEEICSASGLGHVVLDLAGCPAQSGNVYAEGTSGKELVGSVSLLLRSAARPRPLHRQARGLIGYRDAMRGAPLGEWPSVRGLVAPTCVLGDADIDLSDFASLGRTSAIEEDPGESAAIVPDRPTPAFSLAGLSIDEVRALPCGVRGLHVFRYETLPPDFPKSAPVNKECRDCGLALLERRKKSTTPTPSRSRPHHDVPATPEPRPSERAEYPVNLWLDAACFWGSGSIASFEALVSTEGLDPWRAAEVLKHLAWLGHVDVELGANWRPRAWSVAPPTLAFVDSETAVLAGFRNEKLVGEIEDLARCAGGFLEQVRMPSGPNLIRVTGIDLDQAHQAFDVATDDHGRALVITGSPAEKLAAFCGETGSTFSSLAPMTLASNGDFQRFDLDTSRWRRVEDSRDSGAYRLSYAGTQYAFRAPSGQAYSGPHEVVKLAAARLAGIRLHAYSSSEREFTSVLGCEPTGLLSRSLVACSGVLPSVGNGASTYNGVPSRVAAAVLSQLYHGDLPK